MNNNREDKMIQVSLPVLDGSTNGYIPVTTITPAHFSIFQLNKLEDIFLYQKWPDSSRVSVIAMECNLNEQDVQVCGDIFFIE